MLLVCRKLAPTPSSFSQVAEKGPEGEPPRLMVVSGSDGGSEYGSEGVPFWSKEYYHHFFLPKCFEITLYSISVL